MLRRIAESSQRPTEGLQAFRLQTPLLLIETGPYPVVSLFQVLVVLSTSVLGERVRAEVSNRNLLEACPTSLLAVFGWNAAWVGSNPLVPRGLVRYNQKESCKCCAARS
jgi:hypothetical protein